MGIQIEKPSSLLAPYIRHYWSIESSSPAGTSYSQRIIPSGLIELMLFLKERPITPDPQRSLETNSILSGHQKDFYDLNISGQFRMISVTLEPQTAILFFGIPLSEIHNQNVSLRSLIGDQADRLEQQLYATSSFSKCVSILDSFLEKLIKRNYKTYEIKRIYHSLNLINRSGGVIPVDELAAQACLSRKQYERSFGEYIGSTPKQFLKTIRFQHSLYIKQLHPNTSLTELAHACGYFDQSHMINDYRSLSGKTPREYFTTEAPISDYFSL